MSWKVKELTELDQNGRQLHRDTSSLINKLEEHAEDNIPSQLCSFRHKLVSFIKGVSPRHQRTPATHIQVFMISAEDRRRKPYALPIQCIPYVGLSDAKIRELANKIITEMVKRKMNIAGTDNLILQADSQYLNFYLQDLQQMESGTHCGQKETRGHYQFSKYVLIQEQSSLTWVLKEWLRCSLLFVSLN